MKSVRYTKYVGDLASEIDLEELLQALSDYLLDSGFYDPFSQFQDLDHDMESLREALKRVLESGEFLDQDMRDKLDRLKADGKMDDPESVAAMRAALSSIYSHVTYSPKLAAFGTRDFRMAGHPPWKTWAQPLPSLLLRKQST